MTFLSGEVFEENYICGIERDGGGGGMGWFSTNVFVGVIF